MSKVFIGLGSNVGTRTAYLMKAVQALSTVDGIQLKALSNVYETAPWGDTDQPIFLNAALCLETDILPEVLLKIAKQIEHDIGRTPTHRWGPRQIDIDLLFYGNTQSRTETLTLPHPEILNRSFVLVPLLNILMEPGLKRSLSDALDKLPGKLPILNHEATALFRSVMEGS